MSLASFVPGRVASLTSLWAMVACTEPNPYAMPATDTTGTTTGASTSTGGLEVGTTTSPETTTSTAGADTSGSAGSDGSTGPLACPLDTHACAPVAPDGWSGPLAVRADTPDAPMQDCPADYPLTEDVAFAGLSAPPFVCDCDCAAPVGAGCSSVTLRRSVESDCSPVTATWEVLVDACLDIPAQLGAYWQAPTPDVDSGSCVAVPTVTPTDAAFAERLTLCGLSAYGPEVCDDGSACVPLPTAPLDGRICIWQDGEHECPGDGPYTAASVYHRDRDDDRGCAACSCGDPDGTCGGVVQLVSNNTCDEFLWGNVPTNNSCFMAINQTVQAVRYDQTSVTASCAPSAPAATGEVVATGPITVCCLPQ